MIEVLIKRQKELETMFNTKKKSNQQLQALLERGISELSTINGRYIEVSEMIDTANKAKAKAAKKSSIDDIPVAQSAKPSE